MNSQHTPGPWECSGITIQTTKYVENVIYPYSPRKREIAIASFFDDNDTNTTASERNATDDFEDAMANACLIAAAPAMLEALQDVEKYLIQIDDENGNEHMYECPGEDSCILCQVREVIRLAKGEPEP